NTSASAGLKYWELVIAGSSRPVGKVRQCQSPGSVGNGQASRRRAGRNFAAERYAESRGLLTGYPGRYFDAVVLFAMFTTCTRRFTSDSGSFGSFSLLLP